MRMRGRVTGGVVVLDDPSGLEEGMLVEVIVADGLILDDPGQAIDPAFLIGDHAIDMGLSDLGSNIDHYLYGHPKVEDEK